MNRTEVTNGKPRLPSMDGAMVPIHLPKPPQLPQVSMLPVAPVNVTESLDKIADMAHGRAMDFKLMVQLPDGSQYYLEASMDK